MKKRLTLVILAIWALSWPAPALQAAGEIGSSIAFSLPSVEDTNVSLADFRGRVVMLDFFATWCRPCKEAIPKLNALQRAYGKDGLSVVGYAVDKGGKAIVKPWVVRNGMEFPVVMGDMDTAKAWGVKVLPTTLVIDPQGRVVERFEGVTDDARMVAAFSKYLGKDAPAQPAAAMVNLHKPGQRHIRHFNFYDNEEIGGQKGLVVVVNADLSDQVVEQGVWLQLNLQPQSASGQPQGESKPLYMRVDDPLKEQHILFIRCDQLPPLPEGGRYRSWVAIMDSARRMVEKSWEETVPRPCQGGPRGLITTSTPPIGAKPSDSAAGQEQARTAPRQSAQIETKPEARPEARPEPKAEPQTEEIAGIRLAPNEGPKADLPPRRSGEPRVRRIWVSDNQVVGGRRGMTVHVLADLKGLAPGKGLWLELHISPEARVGTGLSPVAEAKVFRQPVGAGDSEYFPLFVGCDQLPSMPASGFYRTWINLSDGKPQPVERSGDLLVSRPCQTAASSAAAPEPAPGKPGR
jgi:thiol-disulfide isomerase/thioredoxin